MKRVALALLVWVVSCAACYGDNRQLFNGSWIVNEKLSDDTDKQVERAIKQGGGTIKGGKKTRGRYRGGPASQKMYDHISYDDTLVFSFEPPQFRLTYAEGFERVFYSDGRSNVVSTSQRAAPRDYSFAGWEDDVLYVESKPLDAGAILETFSLENDGQQLRVELQLEPSSFLAPIHIVRVYDRVPSLQ